MPQTPKVEVSVLGGWTLAEGVKGDTARGGDGILYNRIDPADSFNWGLMLGVLMGEQVEGGFLFNQQITSLEARGNATTKIGDININGYQGYVAYSLGDSNSTMRPYVLVGGGVTNYGSTSIVQAKGRVRNVGGDTRWSPTVGAGVKLFPSPRVGARFGVRWTPTSIKSDPTGRWCDPFWGCYLVGDSQYSNRWDFSGGLMFRF